MYDFRSLMETFPDLVVANICTPHFDLSTNFKFSCTSQAGRLLARHDFYWASKFEQHLWKLDCLPIAGITLKNTWIMNSAPVMEMSVKELRREIQGRGLRSSGHFEKAGRPDINGPLPPPSPPPRPRPFDHVLESISSERCNVLKLIQHAVMYRFDGGSEHRP
jgi:hypothetical protein